MDASITKLIEYRLESYRLKTRQLAKHLGLTVSQVQPVIRYSQKLDRLQQYYMADGDEYLVLDNEDARHLWKSAIDDNWRKSKVEQINQMKNQYVPRAIWTKQRYGQGRANYFATDGVSVEIKGHYKFSNLHIYKTRTKEQIAKLRDSDVYMTHPQISDVAG